jgi:hypothetical protein
MGANPFTQEQWWIIREAFKDDEQPAPIWNTLPPDQVYRLSDAYIAAMHTAIAAIGTGNVGPWTDYIDVNNRSSSYGGVRVATHGDLTGTGARQGRQSHHVPQFLLVEYFENISDSPSARVARSVRGSTRFPVGIDATGRTAQRFSGTAGQIDFHALDTTGGRGDGLPAVSLAARTHQRGRLHLNAASEWGTITQTAAGQQQAMTQPDYNAVEYKSTMAQGIRMDVTFYEFLKRRMRTAGMDNAIVHPADIVEESLRDRTRYETATYEAIRDTYSWMYGGMIASLRIALNNEDLEAAEYRKSALLNSQAHNAQGELTPTYTPHITALAAVVSAVETKNRDVMRQWRRG